VINGNLFTRDYLLEAIVRSEQWKSLDDAKFMALKQRLMKLVTAFSKNANPNEAQTERDLIYPVLDMLGWTDISVQPNLSTKGRKQIPDALLLPDEKAKAKAGAEPEQWKRFQYGLAIVEAKRWNRPLDRASRVMRAYQQHKSYNTLTVSRSRHPVSFVLVFSQTVKSGAFTGKGRSPSLRTFSSLTSLRPSKFRAMSSTFLTDPT
jgi:hypothetical protein